MFSCKGGWPGSEEELFPAGGRLATEVELEVWLKIGDMDGDCAPWAEELPELPPGAPAHPAIRSKAAENTSEIAKKDFPINTNQ